MPTLHQTIHFIDVPNIDSHSDVDNEWKRIPMGPTNQNRTEPVRVLEFPSAGNACG